MATNYLSSRINKNLIDKEKEDMYPLNANLSLLSNKNSIETLLSLALKNHSGEPSSKSQCSPNAVTPTSKSAKIAFDKLKEDDEDDNEYNEEMADTMAESQFQGLKLKPSLTFTRGTRKGQATNSTKMHGKVDIIRKLNDLRLEPIQIETNQPVSLFKDEPIQQEHSIVFEESPPKDEPILSMKVESFISNPTEETPIKEVVYTQAKYSSTTSSSVLEFAYLEDQNISQKLYMEDKGKTIDSFNNKPNDSLFCIFDGHGGSSVASYLQDNYPSVFKKALKQYDHNIKLALKTSFKVVDLEIKALELVHVGSTGCVVYITKEDGAQVVYTANVGDTRCSLISPINIEKLSYDHRANDPKEKKRVILSNGWVLNERVMGQLMVSRAFGDFELKSFGVKAAPSISRRVINPSEKNQMLIIASDGVWDIIEEREMQNELMFINDTEALCKKIIKNSLAKGSWDNLSCCVVKLT